jgi:hypothetical protein
MPDFIPPIDSATDPNSPITSDFGKQALNNPLAMFEGAPGAPGLKIAALEDLQIGDASFIAYSSSVSASQNSTNQNRLGLIQNGDIRLSISRAFSGGGNSVRVRLNGSQIAQYTGGGTSTLDLSVLRGDVITFEANGGSTSGAIASASCSVRIAPDIRLWPAPSNISDWRF